MLIAGCAVAFAVTKVGATATEYAMLTALAALAVAVRAQAIGNAINSVLHSVGSALSSITVPPV